MKLFMVMMSIVLSSTSLFAQPGGKGKNVELSVSGSYQSYSTGESSRSTSAFLISPRVGVFVFEGLEIEPELVALFPSSSEPLYCINGNISYNFTIAGKGVPFILIGYGISNTVPIFNLPTYRTDFTYGVLNLGAGVKVFLRDDIAIRVEYRYQNFGGKTATIALGSISISQNLDVRISTVQFGFSVLL